MPKIAIIVEYEVMPENRAAFDLALAQNCEKTLRDHGCERMEILRHSSEPDRVALSELWLDEDAITQHRARPGHDADHEAVDQLVHNKRVNRYLLG